jgi:hypothetical protein
VEIARILGWTEIQKGRKADQMNPVAKTCAAAYVLIKAGHCSRDQFDGLSVSSVRDIVQRALTRIEQIEKLGEKNNRPKQETEAAKKHVAKAVGKVARDVKAGKISAKHIGSQVDRETYDLAKEAKKQSPLFAVFGKAVEAQIRKMLKADVTGAKLSQIIESLDLITMEEDVQIVRRIEFELSELSKRAESWRKRLIPTSEKVVSIHQKLLEKEG